MIYREVFPSSRPRRLRRGHSQSPKSALRPACHAPCLHAHLFPTGAACRSEGKTRQLHPRCSQFRRLSLRHAPRSLPEPAFRQPFRKIPAPERLHPNASRRIIEHITLERPLPGRVRDADSSCRVAEPGPSGRIAAVLRFLQTRRRPFLSGGLRQKWRTTSALSPRILPGMRNAGASTRRRGTPGNDVPSADDFARAPASGIAAPPSLTHWEQERGQRLFRPPLTQSQETESGPARECAGIPSPLPGASRPTAGEPAKKKDAASPASTARPEKFFRLHSIPRRASPPFPALPSVPTIPNALENPPLSRRCPKMPVPSSRTDIRARFSTPNAPRLFRGIRRTEYLRLPLRHPRTPQPL